MEKLKPSEKAYEIIKKWESYLARPYKAITEEKYLTIGYGHYGPDVQPKQFLTVPQAEELLRADVAKYADKLAEYCPRLEQHQYDALISLIYNIGWHNFRHSMTGIKCHNIGLGTYTEIHCARAITLWVRASGRVLLGLQRRRIYEANYFLGRETFRIIDGKIMEL